MVTGYPTGPHAVVGLALLALAALLGSPNALAVTPVTPAAVVGEKVTKEQGAVGSVPAFVATALDGSRIDFAERRGRWQVVNFWATWCAPCIKEIPELARFDKERADVDVVGIAFEDSTEEEVRKFLEEHPAGYPVAHVDPYVPLTGFAVPRGLPTTYLIAPDGRIAERLVGPVDGKLLARAIGRHIVVNDAGAGAKPQAEAASNQ